MEHLGQSLSLDARGDPPVGYDVYGDLASLEHRHPFDEFGRRVGDGDAHAERQPPVVEEPIRVDLDALAELGSRNLDAASAAAHT